jgi:hypothetical protein
VFEVWGSSRCRKAGRHEHGEGIRRAPMDGEKEGDVTRLSITHEQCVKGRVKDHAWRLGRVCKCAAPIPYEEPRNAKWCAYCRRGKDSRRKKLLYVPKTNRRWTPRKGRTDLCSKCGNKQRPGKTQCQDCADKHSAYKKNRKAS